MSATVLLVALALGFTEPEKEVAEAEKKAFLELLTKLPTKGEFFTDEAVEKAIPHTRVLLALTEKDIGKSELYPFLALSSGLAGHKEPREYSVKNFAKIAHPKLKLFWAVVLFDQKAASPEILTFLCKALDSKEDARTLDEMLGPNFNDFKNRVKEADALRKQLTIKLVKEHSKEGFPEYKSGFDYTNKTSTFAGGQVLYAVRPLQQRGELLAYNLGDGKTSRMVVPQSKGFTPKYDFESYFDDPLLSVNANGDLFCRWQMAGNGDHGLGLLKKGANAFVVTRVKFPLANSRIVAAANGDWYLLRWSGTTFTVYQIDKELKLMELGTYEGNGFHSIDILDARFIAKDVLHLFWGDVIADGNHLRMRCVDFNVKEKKWLHAREIYRLDKFVSSANEPAVLRLPDDSLHYLWKIDEGAKPTEATGLYYQAEADGKTVKVTPSYQYRAITVGDRIVVCYTLEKSPEKVFFRVIRRGVVGPISEITAAKGRKDELWSEYMLLYADGDRLWFVNTLQTDKLYELKIDEQNMP